MSVIFIQSEKSIKEFIRGIVRLMFPVFTFIQLQSKKKTMHFPWYTEGLLAVPGLTQYWTLKHFNIEEFQNVLSFLRNIHSKCQPFGEWESFLKIKRLMGQIPEVREPKSCWLCSSYTNQGIWLAGMTKLKPIDGFKWFGCIRRTETAKI